MKKIAYLFMGVAGVMIWCTQPAFPDEPVGLFTYVEGRADVLRAPSNAVYPVVEGEGVFVGDTVRTKSYSKVEITFKDASTVRCAPNTRASVEEYIIDPSGRRETASLYLHRGKIRTVVSKRTGPNNFTIKTPHATGAVKGSDIIAFYQAAKTGILVSKGSIATFNNAFPEDVVTVRKGDILVVPSDQPPVSPRPYLDVELKLHEKDMSVPKRRARVTEEEQAAMEGWLSKVTGSVTVRKKDQTTWRDARMEQRLVEGDTIKTDESGSAEVRLENGNSIALQPNSEITLAKLRRDPKTDEYENYVEAKLGKYKFTVERLKGNSKFEVKTPTAVCGIRGTIMHLMVTSQLTQAFYEAGGGVVESLISGIKQLIAAGQNASAGIDGSVSQPQFTTNEQRMQLDESWGSGEGIEGYSSPANNAGGTAGGFEVVGGGGGGTTTPPEGGTTAPLIDIPFQDRTGNPPTGGLTTNMLVGLFPDGTFGYFDDGEFQEDEDSFIGGALVSLLEPISWRGPFRLEIGGAYHNPNSRTLWYSDTLIAYTLDGTEMAGLIGGAMHSWNGALTTIYMTASGLKGVTLGKLAGDNVAGDNGEGLFEGSGVFDFVIPMSQTQSSWQNLATDMGFRGEFEGLLGSGGGSIEGDLEMRITQFDNDPGWGIWGSVFDIGKYRNPENQDLWYGVWGGEVEHDEDMGGWQFCAMRSSDNLDPRAGIVNFDTIGLYFSHDGEGESFDGVSLCVGSGTGTYTRHSVFDYAYGEAIGAGFFFTPDVSADLLDELSGEPEGLGLLVVDGAGLFAGGPGALDVDFFFGGIVGGGESDRGLWFLRGAGTYTQPTGRDWYLALAGPGYGYDDNERYADSAWLAMVNGEAWGSGMLSGTLRGYRFAGDGGDGLTAGFISEHSGDVVGNYVEGEEFTWNMVGAGEWVEVTDLLDSSIFDAVGDIEQFVSVPITEAHTSFLQGAGGAFTIADGGILAGTMDVNFFSNHLGTVWAAMISGTYEGTTGNTWNLPLSNADGTVTLTGDRWDEGDTGEWHATVQGTQNSMNLAGEAAGTFADGTFEGIGAGTAEAQAQAAVID